MLKKEGLELRPALDVERHERAFVRAERLQEAEPVAI